MERNRRIAKAYARAPILTITGSAEGFDGYKIGLNGFESATEDPLVKRVKNHIGKVGYPRESLESSGVWNLSDLCIPLFRVFVSRWIALVILVSSACRPVMCSFAATIRPQIA